jgi:hypothetical protein
LFNYRDIKYCDFLNNKELLVLNSKKELHVWSLETYEIITRLSLSDVDIVINIIPVDGRFIILDTSNGYILIEKDGNELIKKEDVTKKENSKVFVLDSDKEVLKLFMLDYKDNIEIVNKKL